MDTCELPSSNGVGGQPCGQHTRWSEYDCTGPAGCEADIDMCPRAKGRGSGVSHAGGYMPRAHGVSDAEK